MSEEDEPRERRAPRSYAKLWQISRFCAKGEVVDIALCLMHYIRNGYMAHARTPQDLLPLTPAVFHILLSLSEGERHGYAIMQDVATDTDGALQLGPGTLYGCLKRMLAARLVEESDDRPDPKLDDERRRYYRITDLGTQTVRAEADRLAAAVSAAQAKRLFSRRGIPLQGRR